MFFWAGGFLQRQEGSGILHVLAMLEIRVKIRVKITTWYIFFLCNLLLDPHKGLILKWNYLCLSRQTYAYFIWIDWFWAPIFLNGNLLYKLSYNWNPPILRVGLNILIISCQLTTWVHPTSWISLVLGAERYLWEIKPWKFEVATLFGFRGEQFEIWGGGSQLKNSPKWKTTCIIANYVSYYTLWVVTPYI